MSTNTKKPFIFYFLALFLTALATFIGWNFGGTPGAIIGFIFSAIINAYARTIEHEE